MACHIDHLLFHVPAGREPLLNALMMTTVKVSIYAILLCNHVFFKKKKYFFLHFINCIKITFEQRLFLQENS